MIRQNNTYQNTGTKELGGNTRPQFQKEVELFSVYKFITSARTHK